MKFDILNRFTGNVQFTAEIDCSPSATKPVKVGMAVKRAILTGADLAGADLVRCGTRSDGYEFYAHIRDGKIWIKAGCRYFTVKDARQHWRKARAGTQLGDESLQLVKNAVALVKTRGMLEAAE